MIQEINAILERIGSKFRTDDGVTLVGNFCVGDGSITFLRRTFESPESCLEFVNACQKQN